MLRRLFISLMILLPLVAMAKSQIFHDAVGDKLILNKPARRIISLAPNLTEIVFAAGAGKYLVGVSSFSDYPLVAKNIPVVATFNDLDMEKIVSLHPDLVVAWQGGNPLRQLNQLRKLGIPVYVESFSKITDIPKNILAIGKLTGTNITARKAANKFMHTFTKLKHNYAHKKPVKVFYELSLQPLMTLNERSLVGQVIHLCGGKNIFATTRTLAPHVNVASVLAANPQLIFVSKQADDVQAIKIWNAYQQLTAAQKHHIFTVDSNRLERYGPRILEGAQQVCADIDMVRKKGDAIDYAHHENKFSKFLSLAHRISHPAA
jgi:iron complex transport system substrate-binding protein